MEGEYLHSIDWDEGKLSSHALRIGELVACHVSVVTFSPSGLEMKRRFSWKGRKQVILAGEENTQPFYCIIAMMVVSMMLFQLLVVLSSIQFATDAGSTV